MGGDLIKKYVVDVDQQFTLQFELLTVLEIMGLELLLLICFGRSPYFRVIVLDSIRLLLLLLSHKIISSFGINRSPVISLFVFQILRNHHRYNIRNRTMSIARKASKTALRVTPEDLAATLDQKNNMIGSLQMELQRLRVNQEKFDRVKEELTKGRFRYECLLRDQETASINGEERLELSVRNVQELRIQSEHLNDEMKVRGQALKEVRLKTQELIDYSNQKEDEATEIKIKLQEQRSCSEGLKLEEERTRVQINQLREEVEKNRRENGTIRVQNDSINEKNFKTQSYIRGLLREEASLNENLSRIEDENNKLSSGISELNTVVSINENCMVEKDKDCQELLFQIANKELEKKKIDNETREKLKQLSAEKEKWRQLCEQWEQKRQEGMRLDAHLTEASSEISFILSKNNQIADVNEKLSCDLQVCQKHQENVQKVNKNLDAEISHLKETSLKAINKLQEPFNFRTNTSPFSNIQNYSQNNYVKWSSSSKMSDFQTGDFECKSQRN